MTQEPYLLTLEETSGGHTFITRHVIEAEDDQMVKYHYHRTLRDWGYTDPYMADKHALQGPHVWTEIMHISPLKPEEYDILSKYLPSWSKV